GFGLLLPWSSVLRAAAEQAREEAALCAGLALVPREDHQRRRRHDERQHRSESEAVDDGARQRNPPLGRRSMDRHLMAEDLEAEAEGDRQDAEDRRYRRQHHGPRTLATGLQDGVVFVHALLAQPVI